MSTSDGDADLLFKLCEEGRQRLQFHAAKGEAPEVTEIEGISTKNIFARGERNGIFFVKLDRGFAGILRLETVNEVTNDGDLLKGHRPWFAVLLPCLRVYRHAVDFDDDHFSIPSVID